MFKHIISGGLALATIVAGSLVGSATANAEKAVHRDSYVDQFSGRDDFLSDVVCGFEVLFEVDARGHARFFADGSIQAHDRGTFTLINPANGKTLTQFWAGQFRGQGTETWNDDGTLTIVFDEEYNGVHEKWLDPDGGVLIMDRGRARISGTVVIDFGDPDDPFDDQFDVDETFDLRGPHPILEGEGLDPALACELLA